MLFKIKATVQVKKKKGKTGKPFNPLTFDVANLLALYDGNTLKNDPPGQWADQSANGYDLTLVNNPTIVAAAINGHDAIQFDGINQYGSRAVTPILNGAITEYIVFQSIAAMFPDRITTAENSANKVFLISNLGGNDLAIYSGLFLTVVPQLLIGNYGIMTNVFNNINSEIRNNNNAAAAGNDGGGNGTGFSIAAETTPLGEYWNGEIAYIILRSGADNTATQNLFINWLKNRFAL